MTERFFKDKGVLHFILITSDTSYFKEYEERFYQESVNKEYSFTPSMKVNKQLNLKEIKNLKKNEDSKKIRVKLKEYDNMKTLVKSLLNSGFPYVSVASGGFYDIHNDSIKYSIPLLNHNSNICSICQSKNSKKFMNSSSLSFISNIFGWNNSNEAEKKFSNTEEKKFKIRKGSDESSKSSNIRDVSNNDNFLKIGFTWKKAYKPNFTQKEIINR